MQAVFLLFTLLNALPENSHVLRIIPGDNIIGISVGLFDNIKKGDVIDVWRDKKRIAISNVIEVGQHVSICRVIWWKPGTKVRKGDMIRMSGANQLEPGIPKKPKIKIPKKPVATQNKSFPPKKTTQHAETISPPAKKILPPPAKKIPAPPAKKIPAPPAKYPPLAPQLEKLFAVGTTNGTIFVSSTAGVYIFKGNNVRLDKSTIAHKIYRFVPWKDKMWAETDGGVLLWNKGKWLEFPWSKNLNIKKPSFARITVSGDNTWGSFSDQILYWDPKSNVLEVIGKKTFRRSGSWVRIGHRNNKEIESILAGANNNLVIATATGKILLQDGRKLSLLGDLSFVGKDPLILDLVKDFRDSIWGLYHANGGGIFRCTKQGLDIVKRTNSGEAGMLPEGPVMRLATNRNGKLFALHKTMGVYSHSFGKWQLVSGKTKENFIDMAIEDDGSILLLTERRLLRIGATEEELFSFYPEAVEPIKKQPQKN